MENAGLVPAFSRRHDVAFAAGKGVEDEPCKHGVRRRLQLARSVGGRNASGCGFAVLAIFSAPFR
jgi:hypothetical protein